MLQYKRARYFKSEKSQIPKKFNKSENQKTDVKKYELSEKNLNYLKNYSDKIGIKFLVSIFDLKSLHLAKKWVLKH